MKRTIERKRGAKPSQRITNIKPWPRKRVEKAYQHMGKEWDEIEAAGTRAEGKPKFYD